MLSAKETTGAQGRDRDLVRDQPLWTPVMKEGADGGSGFLVTDKIDTWESGGSGWSLLWGTEPNGLAITLEVASGMWPLFWGRGEGLQ